MKNIELSDKKADIAVNIFAKPFQTALSLLSLIKQSSESIGEFWLQFEPVGSKYDSITSYYIAEFLQNKGWMVHVFQPEEWHARQIVDEKRLSDNDYRLGIRYQYAFENSLNPLLFIIHNDVYFIKNLLKALIENIGDAFAIGQVGQCWNCPASRAEITREVMNCDACSPETYAEFKPDLQQLKLLYAKAREKNIFVRPYDAEGFTGEFSTRPWPLPECRVNEWICLVNLELIRPLIMPYGNARAFGGFYDCANHNLDTAIAWFRDLHQYGYKAKNYNIKPYVRHWVGTGNKSFNKYAYSEDRALKLLKTHFPEYIDWLQKRTTKVF